MKTKIILLAAVIMITTFGCIKKTRTDKPLAKKNNALIIGNPLDCGIENLLIFPVGSNYKAVVYESSENEADIKFAKSSGKLSFSLNTSSSLYDRAAEKEYLNTDEDKFDIRNILFYDLSTGKTYPLVTDTLHILSFAIHREFGKALIFYRVVKNDNNSDSIYNSKDPVMLFISDIYGKNLTQITPADEQFSEYTYYKQTKTILIKSIIDSDKDKCFTNIDETNFREMKILEPKMGREIFAKSLKDSLRTQLKAN
ncbi:MAG: hypothetical protein NTZ33_06670 [Bacteroidetes bacterium]|nr:hypothetical protein [Bacteroidota bacterium]